MEDPNIISQVRTTSPTPTFASAVTSQSVHQQPQVPQYPAAPKPDSGPGQVRQFLIAVFLANRSDRSVFNETEAREGAEALAAKLAMSGHGLYMLSKETLVGTFGPEGEVVYRIVQDGRYGFEGGPWPALKIISKILVLVAGGTGAYQAGKESKDRNLTATYVCVGIVTFIIVFYYICSTQKVVQSRYWPERIKIRNRNAAGAISFIPW